MRVGRGTVVALGLAFGLSAMGAGPRPAAPPASTPTSPPPVPPVAAARPAPPDPPHERGAWIGVWLADEVDGGVRIVALVPGGPAQQARLLVGDLIVQANQAPIAVQTALSRVLDELEPGQPLELQVLRAGEPIAARVLAESRPARGYTVVRHARPSPPTLLWRQPPGPEQFGLEVAEITPALREHFGAPADAGVLVVRCDPERSAAKAGVRVGDVLVAVGDQRIVRADRLPFALVRWSGAEPLQVQVVRDRAPRALTVAALESPAPEAQDRTVRRIERDSVEYRLRLELERLERRSEEIRRELERLARETPR